MFRITVPQLLEAVNDEQDSAKAAKKNKSNLLAAHKENAKKRNFN